MERDHTLPRCLIAILLLLAPGAASASDAPAAEPLSFRHAVDLALQHSGVMAIATINQWRAHQNYLEARAHYIPQFTIGSGLGYSYGFPLTLEGSAPSVVNFTTSQALWNPSLQQFMKAARLDWRATSIDLQDKRNAVILDTALAFAQLDQLTSKIKALEDAETAARSAESITQQRLQEGVDTKLNLNKSQLTAARIRLRIAGAEGQMDVLREHLSKLTGLPAGEITLEPESMPAMPDVSQEADLTSRALESSPAVRLADEKVRAAELRAKGEHRGKWPIVDAASQYAYLARFNNYDQYYLKYNANNLSAGLNIRFPFFNKVQDAKASEADADAAEARKRAELTRNQVGEDTIKLQRSLRQLEAARDVAKLEWQVSQGELEAVQAKIGSGDANTRDLQNAQLDVNDRRAAYLDADFELSRAELQLLRLTGELENWAIPPP